jgi:hypothetical protein
MVLNGWQLFLGAISQQYQIQGQYSVRLILVAVETFYNFRRRTIYQFFKRFCHQTILGETKTVIATNTRLILFDKWNSHYIVGNHQYFGQQE